MPHPNHVQRFLHAIGLPIKDSGQKDQIRLKRFERWKNAACSYFQPGGKYHHLMKAGDDLIVDGLKALDAEIERLKAELRRRG